MKTLGACGDNCEVCPRFKATTEKETTSLEQITALWIKLGWRKPEVRSSELRCWGCRESTTCAYSQLKRCTVERNVANCGECELYPCPLTEEAIARTEGLLEGCISLCNGREFESLSLAFGQKRQNLNRVRERKA